MANMYPLNPETKVEARKIPRLKGIPLVNPVRYRAIPPTTATIV